MQPTASAHSTDSCVIVPAQAQHMPAICDIYAHYVQTAICTMEVVPPTVAAMQMRLEALQRDGLPWLVASDGRDVLGYAYAGRYRPRVGYYGTVETSIYLHPDHVGRRIGQALLGALIEECVALALRQMVAVIVDSEDTAGSIRLHERFGFKRVGLFEKVGHKLGRDVDTLLMQRSLAAR